MTLKDILDNPSFLRFALVLWFFSSFFVLFLLGRIDLVVHDELYDFGLQFSFVWANPYWTALRLIYICLAIPSVFSAIVLGLDFWKKFNNDKRFSRRGNKLPKVQSLKGNSMLVSCPSCKKTFGKPLVILDSSSGKAKLANVCPYCDAILGEVSEIEDEKDLKTGVLSPDERVKVK